MLFFLYHNAMPSVLVYNKFLRKKQIDQQQCPPPICYPSSSSLHYLPPLLSRFLLHPTINSLKHSHHITTFFPFLPPFQHRRERGKHEKEKERIRGDNGTITSHQLTMHLLSRGVRWEPVSLSKKRFPKKVSKKGPLNVCFRATGEADHRK